MQDDDDDEIGILAGPEAGSDVSIQGELSKMSLSKHSPLR